MSEIKKVFLNIVYFLSKRVIELFSLFLFYIIIARELGVESFGIFTFAVTFTMIIGILSDLGLQRFLNRESARNFDETSRYIPIALSIKAVLSVISFLMMVLIINLFDYPQQIKTIVYILGFSVILFSFQTFFSNILRGLQKIDIEVRATFWEKPLLLLFTVIILHIRPSLVTIAWIYCLLRLGTLLLIVFMSLKIKILAGKERVKFTYKNAYSLLKRSLPYGVFFLFGLIYFYIDTIMLSYMKGNESVGIYQAAIKFAVFLMIIPEAITEVVLPRMTEYFETSRKNLEQLFSRTIKLLIFLGFPIAAVSIFFNTNIINISFGRAFDKSAVLLPIIGCMLLFRFIASGLGITLTACGMQKTRTFIIVLCAVVNIGLNSFLIPLIDYTGAAYATLATNLFLLITYMIILKKKTGLSIKPVVLLKALLSFAGMIISLFILVPINIYAAFLISLIIYVFSFHRLRILETEDLTLLKNVISVRGDRPDPDTT